MKKKLTVAVLDALVCPEGKPNCLVFDTEITGFAVRVSKSGAKRFLLQFTRRGRTKRLVLGKYGEITLHQARQKALVALGDVVDGGDAMIRASESTITALTPADYAAGRRFAAARIAETLRGLALPKKEGEPSWTPFEVILGGLADTPKPDAPPEPENAS